MLAETVRFSGYGKGWSWQGGEGEGAKRGKNNVVSWFQFFFPILGGLGLRQWAGLLLPPSDCSLAGFATRASADGRQESLGLYHHKAAVQEDEMTGRRSEWGKTYLVVTRPHQGIVAQVAADVGGYDFSVDAIAGDEVFVLPASSHRKA